jgi:hypothetical protein
MMRLMDITTIRITMQATIVILLTLLDHIMVQQTGKAITERTPITIGLDTTEHSMRAVLITMPLQANILAPRTRILTILEVMGVRGVLGVMLALQGLAVRVEMLAWLDQAGLRLLHDRRVVRANVEAQAEEEV